MVVMGHGAKNRRDVRFVVEWNEYQVFNKTNVTYKRMVVLRV